MQPLHARTARLSAFSFYRQRRRRRRQLEFKTGRFVLQNQARIRLVLGALALLFVELGFALGVVVQRWRGC